MLFSRSIVTSILLLATAIFVSSVLIQPSHPYNLQTQNPLQYIIPEAETVRFLQATSVNNKAMTASINKIVSQSNIVRAQKGVGALKLKPNLQTIVKQWVNIRQHLSLNKYLSLYGIQLTQSYSFASIPPQYIVPVVLKKSPGLTNQLFSNVGIYSNLIDKQNYQIIVVLEGGDEQLEQQFTAQEIAKVIVVIQEEQKIKKNKQLAPNKEINVNVNNGPNPTKIEYSNNEKDTINININIVQQTTVQTPINVQKKIDTPVSTQKASVAVQKTPEPVHKEVVPPTVEKAPEPVQKIIHSVTVEKAPLAVQKVPEPVQEVIVPSVTIQQEIMPPVTVQKVPEPVQKEIPTVTIENTPVTIQKAPEPVQKEVIPVIVQKVPEPVQKEIVPPVTVQKVLEPVQKEIIAPVTVQKTPEPVQKEIVHVVQKAPEPVQKIIPTVTIEKASVSVQKTPEPVEVIPPVVVEKAIVLPVTVQKTPAPIQKPVIAVVVPKMPTIPVVTTLPIQPVIPKQLVLPVVPRYVSTPTNNSGNSNALSLITLSESANDTQFEDIVLTHNLPSTFVKNQIFPFRGYITRPNPKGVRVNVIFIRVSDQRKLFFHQALQRNENQFQIFALLNMTGNFYISVFVGQQGLTSYNQYKVIPSFFGKIVSRSPKPLEKVSINLKGNDLWLSWNHSDVKQPPITRIVFTQQNGASLSFLLSNFEDSFQVPYNQFVSFSTGITTISFSQAFSSTQSAASRTSQYSAPYNIIFNAANHNFAKIASQNPFKPIPYQIKSGESIQLLGSPTFDIKNEVILLSPSNEFISFFISSKPSDKLIKSGAHVDLNITLKDTGVYILQVNDAKGQCILNVPIYVGDIYPLLPDFIDLAPIVVDQAALNEPQILYQRRSLVIQMINEVRKRFGAPTVYFDNKLNSLAQNYSSLQVQQNFFGHIDPQGNNPSQRAKAAGIAEDIGENIAINSNLTEAQLMLERSPAHLRTIVNAKWTRVGLGIVQNNNNLYYLTQEFSSRDMQLYPLKDNQLALIQSGIVKYILTTYPSLQAQNKTLSEDLKNKQIANAAANTISYLKDLGYRNIGVNRAQISYNSGNYMDSIRSQKSFAPASPNYKQIGVSVVYDGGLLKIQVAYQ